MKDFVFLCACFYFLGSALSIALPLSLPFVWLVSLLSALGFSFDKKVLSSIQIAKPYLALFFWFVSGFLATGSFQNTPPLEKETKSLSGILSEVSKSGGEILLDGYFEQRARFQSLVHPFSPGHRVVLRIQDFTQEFRSGQWKISLRVASIEPAVQKGFRLFLLRSELLESMKIAKIEPTVIDFWKTAVLRFFVEKEIALPFSLSGLSHILAVSGLHINILSGVIIFLLSLRTNRFFIPLWLKLLIFYCALVSFALMIGISASVFRAVVFGILLFSGQESKVIVNPFRLLGFCLIFHLFCFPAEIFGAVFYLTYGFTLTMLLSSVVEKEIFARKTLLFSPIVAVLVSFLFLFLSGWKLGLWFWLSIPLTGIFSVLVALGMIFCLFSLLDLTIFFPIFSWLSFLFKPFFLFLDSLSVQWIQVDPPVILYGFVFFLFVIFLLFCFWMTTQPAWVGALRQRFAKPKIEEILIFSYPFDFYAAKEKADLFFAGKKYAEIHREDLVYLFHFILFTWIRFIFQRLRIRGEIPVSELTEFNYLSSSIAHGSLRVKVNFLWRICNHAKEMNLSEKEIRTIKTKLLPALQVVSGYTQNRKQAKNAGFSKVQMQHLFCLPSF